MIEMELFAEHLVREREGYFASPRFKARADWRTGLLAKVRRQPRPTAERQYVEPRRETAPLF